MLGLAAYLADCDKTWNPQLKMVGRVYHSPGYHSFLPEGSISHPTRDAVEYAAALFTEGSPAHVSRGREVLAHLLTLQEKNPYVATFGIWSWHYEEPLSKMSPPDWNWADFIGAGLAYILREHAKKLTPELDRETRAALERAGYSIFRRNVQPDYTNIAIMGAAVTAAAGELCGVPFLLDYGRVRLRIFVDFIRATGGFNEYNSPCYTFVAMHESERILQLVADPAVRAAAEELRVMIWEALSKFFHPGTGQMSPPWSRAYADTLPGTAVDFLRRTTGVSIPGPSSPVAWSPVRELPCPEHLKSRFAALPVPEEEVRMRFIAAPDDANSTYGVAWLSKEACIGSVSHDSLWVQRRPLSAFWVLPQSGPAVFNTDAWKDGKEFSSIGLESVQSGPRVLSHAVAYTNRGDYHLFLDAPAGREFRLRELALGWELIAPDASIRKISDRCFVLSAGNWQIAVSVAPAKFMGEPVELETVETATGVMLRAVLCRGAERTVKIDGKLELSIPFAVELAPAGTAVTAHPFEIENSETGVGIRWNGLKLTGHRFGADCK